LLPLAQAALWCAPFGPATPMGATLGATAMLVTGAGAGAGAGAVMALLMALRATVFALFTMVYLPFACGAALYRPNMCTVTRRRVTHKCYFCIAAMRRRHMARARGML
jgi:hypothetical protein